MLIICATLTTIRRFVTHVAPQIINEKGSAVENSGSGSGGFQQHSFRTTGSRESRKNVDEFGMTVNEETTDLRIIAATEVMKVDVVVNSQDENDVHRALPNNWQRLGSIGSSKGSVSETFTWNSGVGGDELEARRAISQTIIVVREDRRIHVDDCVG